jgi:large subunit ribosomal protein L6
VVQNMVTGVSEGYTKHMEVYGVGYGVQVQGQNLSITCGRSHPVILSIPTGVNVEVQTPQARGDNDPARFTVAGADKQMVGEFAARARKARLPEPYKGKGVRYAGERIRRKAGKQFAGAGAK